MQTAGAMGQDEVFVDECAGIFERQHVDAVDFVRSTETIKEMQERHAGFERGHLVDHGHILGFLNARRGQHCETGGTGVHDVAVVAENRKCMACEAACGNVEYCGCQFTGDFEHVGDLEQQSLGCRERRGQRTTDE